MAVPKMNPQELSQFAYQWLDERLAISDMIAMGEKKLVPRHKHSLWYYMGGIAMVLVAVQFVTGSLLMVYYIPEIQSAYTSVLNINSKVDFGWLIRSFHSWGANLMILALFVHMFSTYFMKAYRAPRELTWLTGLGLLVLAFGFGFTGYLLPWDEIAFFATKVGIDVTAQGPFVGELIADILRGGKEISQATLSRFFLIHVIVLPLSLMGLLGLHLLLIQKHGISEPESVQKLPAEQKRYEKFFPDFAMKDALVWLMVLNVLAVCATIFPWGLGTEADPFAPAPEGIKPEWYFLAMFQFLKYIPPYVGPIEGEQFGLMLFSGVGLALAATPFIDRGQNKAISKLFQVLGIILLILFVLFTILGAM